MTKEKKQKKLRHSEYYDLQEYFDNLYAKSKQGKVFTNLMELISSEENIRLGVLIASTIYADTKTQSEGIALILSIGLILFIIVQIAKVLQYYTDANFKDKYLFDALNVLSYYSDK